MGSAGGCPELLPAGSDGLTPGYSPACQSRCWHGAEVPLQPLEKTMRKQVVLLQPMDNHNGADTHAAAHRQPAPEQAPGSSCV